MVQILRANIVTTAGTIVRDYTAVADELGVYMVEDIETERRLLHLEGVHREKG